MASFLTIIASCAVLSIAEMSVIDNSTTTVLNYVEKLTEDLGITQDQNLRFVFDQGFVRLNTQSKDKTTLTTTLDTSSIDMASTFKLQAAFVKFHKHSVSYDFNVDVEGGVSLTGNTRDLTAKTTATTDLFDMSWILDQWKEQGNHAKLTVQFNITKSARKQPKSLVLKTWQKFVRDKTWQQYGPVFLVAYFKDVSKLTMPLSGNFGPRLRSASTTQCKLHSFQATFTELGLSDVFVKPTGSINFSVCYGQCDASGSVDSRAGHMTTHAWVLELARRVLPNPTVPKNHLQSSCVPTAYQGVRVLKKEPNGNLVYQVIQDLTASACGCRCYWVTLVTNTQLCYTFPTDERLVTSLQSSGFQTVHFKLQLDCFPLK